MIKFVMAREHHTFIMNILETVHQFSHSTLLNRKFMIWNIITDIKFLV